MRTPPPHIHTAAAAVAAAVLAFRSQPRIEDKTGRRKRSIPRRDNFRQVEPVAKVVLMAGFEAFNLPLYRQVVSDI